MNNSNNAEIDPERKPLITVCIATFNQQNYIRDAVMSVLAQRTPSVFNLEILVGDDGSTDATPCILYELAEQYADCLSVVTHHPNIGGTQNYRSLIRLAKGDYLAHLDGDDYWLPGKLLAQLTFLEQHPECIAVYTGAMVIDTKMHLLGSFTTSQPTVFGLDRLLSEGNFLCHSTLLYRASEIQGVLNLPSPFLDFEIHLLLATNNFLGFISQQLAIYRSLVIGSVTRDRRDLIDQLYFTALKKHLPAAIRSTRAQGIAHYAVNMAAAYPKRMLENVFWKSIDELKNGADVPAYAILGCSAKVFWRILKRKLSSVVANFFNSRERFIVFYPTR